MPKMRFESEGSIPSRSGGLANAPDNMTAEIRLEAEEVLLSS
jgi:hypothetical protein